MKFNLYKDIHEFYKDTYDVLMKNEGQNMIILGNIILGHEGKDKTEWRDPINWLMATISDIEGIKITALMTPPHNITLYATDNIINHDAITCLIDGLIDYDIPGVTTEKSLATYFANEYATRRGLGIKTTMDQRIYELKAVSSSIKQIGRVRLLEEKDMAFFPYWMEAFKSAETYGKTEMSMPQEKSLYLNRIASKKIYVLEDQGLPVSMAGFTRHMQSAVGVAFVYTPHYNRGRGYASSCVAQISQIALDQGFTKCILYTDLLNPISNSIYQKIGYQKICDSLMLKFQ